MAQEAISESEQHRPTSAAQGAVFLVLCATLPVLDFALGNFSDLAFQPWRLLLYFAALLGGSLAIAALIKLARPRCSAGHALVISGAMVLVTFSYYLIAGAAQHIPVVGSSTVTALVAFLLTMAAAIAILIRFGSRSGLVGALIFGLGAMCIYNAIFVMNHFGFTVAKDAAAAAPAQKGTVSDWWPRDPAALGVNTHFKGEGKLPPNIYFILPDMFMGKNEYQRMTDGGPYEMDEKLRERGFTVLENHYSNAPVTRFSLATVFGMEYFADSSSKVTTEMLRKIPWRTKSSITKNFRERGYNVFWYVDPYVSRDCDRLADFCFVKPSTFDAQDLTFLERAPFFDLISAFGDDSVAVWRSLVTYQGRYEIPEVLDSLPQPGASPHFTFMHFGLPHSPYRLRGDCSYYDPSAAIRKNKHEGSVAAYRQHVECAATQYTQLLDAILERDPEAWIIFQADHGVNYHGQSTREDMSALSEEAVGQNLSALSAYRLPERCTSEIPDDMSPVNTFRLVFACLDDKKPEFLPGKHFLMYYLSWQPGGEVRDVTDIIRKRRASFEQSRAELAH